MKLLQQIVYIFAFIATYSICATLQARSDYEKPVHSITANATYAKPACSLITAPLQYSSADSEVHLIWNSSRTSSYQQLKPIHIKFKLSLQYISIDVDQKVFIRHAYDTYNIWLVGCDIFIFPFHDFW